MPTFSPAILAFWRGQFAAGQVLHQDAGFTLTVNPALTDDSRVMLLQLLDDQVMAVVTPALAERIGLAPYRGDWSASRFRRMLNDAHVRLHGADYLFYFSDPHKRALQLETSEGTVRRLTQDDAELFTAFQAAASAGDLDAAYVELDHWAVFGAFDRDRLVCAASMYPWQGSRIADLGVLTLPAFRGRGHARRVVRAISRHACDQGYEPQYRCQTDNEVSIRLARAAGLTLFGQWEAVSPESSA